MRNAIAQALAADMGRRAAPPPPPPADDHQWDSFSAAMAAEGMWDMAGVEPSEEAFLSAYQFLIDSGVVWQLQGAFGRQAAALIDAGHCSQPN